MATEYTAAQSLQYVTGPSGAASATQLAQAWFAAGGHKDSAVEAVAIALAEQGQYAWGINIDPPGASAGAWQLHYDNWGTFVDAGIIKSPNDLKDLTKNADCAIYLSGNGANWKPWSTYPAAAATHLAQAKAAVDAITGGAGGGSSSGGTTWNAPDGLSVALSLAGNVFQQWDSFITSPALDVFAKAIIVCVLLIGVALIPATRKFAVWAAAILFFLLMLHSSSEGSAPNGQSAAPMPPASQLGQPKIVATNTVLVNGQQTSQGGSSGMNLGEMAQLAALLGGA